MQWIHRQIGVLLKVSIATAHRWPIAIPRCSSLVGSDVEDIQMVDTGVWEDQLSDGAPGAFYAWSWSMAATLEAWRWTPRNCWRPDQHPTYTMVTSRVFARHALGRLRDRVVLNQEQLDANAARLQLRRWIDMSGWR